MWRLVSTSAHSLQTYGTDVTFGPGSRFDWKVLVGCRSEIESMMAIVVKGDAMSTSDLEKAFANIEDVDAVVSTIGGTPADPSSDSQVGDHYLRGHSLGVYCNGG